MEASAILHNMDKRFCYALEKGKFLLRIKTKKNDMKQVTLHIQDKYIPLEYMDTRSRVLMKKAASDDFSDYYEAVISIDVVCLRYFFELEDTNGDVLYYGNYRFYKEPIAHIDFMFDCPQNLREEECFIVPEWAANKVVYQIFPSRFATTHPVSDEVWYQTPIGHRADLKGNLPGVIARLPYLQALGVDIIYFTPLFMSNTSHKYDTVDYYKIDSSFGTEQDLCALVEQAHALGIKVILDAVFNHTSTDFFAFKDIKENGKASPYLDWYYINSFPLRGKWGEKPSYKTFSYFGGMPKLNLQNKDVQNYVLDVARYWMRNCNIDGWRLDVGDEISHRFWKIFRAAIKEENPNALIIGEIWHSANDFLEGDEWDTIMNYDFRFAVKDFIAENKITATQFTERMGFLRGTTHTKVYPLLWNLIDSHDTERFLYSCAENKDKMKLAASIQLLSEGMPMIYYGDECGLSGGPDPDCRRGMLWNESRQDKDLLSWYQKLISLRKAHPAITTGEISNLYTDDSSSVIAITRTLDNETVTILFHNGDSAVTCDLFDGTDLITGESFPHRLEAYQTVVLV